MPPSKPCQQSPKPNLFAETHRVNHALRKHAVELHFSYEIHLLPTKTVSNCSHFNVYNDPGHEDYVAKSNPNSTVGNSLEIGPGETEIVCRISLASGESCTVSISAKLATRVAIQINQFVVFLCGAGRLAGSSAAHGQLTTTTRYKQTYL